jgi:phage terminase large subunit-like protein
MTTSHTPIVAGDAYGRAGQGRLVDVAATPRAKITSLAPRALHKMVPPPPTDPVTQYALDVVAARIVACRYVRKACERHLSDLATGGERGLRWEAKQAQHSIGFYHLLHHYKGRDDLIVLEGWEKFVVGSAFGWKRADGSRRFRTVYLEVGSGNGKSTIAGGAGLRLAFFDGEPGGEVYSAATKHQQAKIPWTAAMQMVLKSASLRKRIQINADSLSQISSASFFQPLGRDSDSDQGIRPNGAIIDELHVHDSRDLLDNIEKAGSTRRQPMVWKITTAGVKREGVWWEERSDAIAVLEGRATDDSMFAIVYTLDEGDDPFDEAVWIKANPNLGVSVGLDFLRERAAKAKRSPGALQAYLRFHMNVPTQQSTRAIDIDEWDKCAGLVTDADGNPETYEEWTARVLPERTLIYAGLDLASLQDLTALVAVGRGPEGTVDVLCRFWCPEEGTVERSRRDGVPYDDWIRDGYLIATPGNVTDHEFIRAEINKLAAVYELVDLGYDSWGMGNLEAELPQDGASIFKISQTWTGLAPGWHEFERLVLEHKVRHGGHPILRWMAGNVETETDAAGNQKPSKARSSEKIDGMVALDMAIARLMAHAGDEVVEPFVIGSRR